MIQIKQGELLLLTGQVLRRPVSSDDPLVAVDPSSLGLRVDLLQGSKIMHQFNIDTEAMDWVTEPLNTSTYTAGDYAIEIGIVSNGSGAIAHQSIPVKVLRSPMGRSLVGVVEPSQYTPMTPMVDDGVDYDYQISWAATGNRASFTSLSPSEVNTTLIGRVIKGKDSTIDPSQMDEIVAAVLAQITTENIATVEYVDQEINKTLGVIDAVLETI